MKIVLLVASCKEVKKIKHVHKPLYLLSSNISYPYPMNFDKGVQVDQVKIKRQSIDFSVHKYLDSIVIPFSLDVTKRKGILGIKILKEGIKVRHGLLNHSTTPTSTRIEGISTVINY